jgi:CRISPR-associated endonuclease/helicase Cas3
VCSHDFAEFFRQGTEREPYRYQLELAIGPRPDVLEAPTGRGKTQAILGSWLYQRAQRPKPNESGLVRVYLIRAYKQGVTGSTRVPPSGKILCKSKGGGLPSSK